MTSRTAAPWRLGVSETVVFALLAAGFAGGCAGAFQGNAAAPAAASLEKQKVPAVGAGIERPALRPIVNILFTGTTMGYAAPCG